MSFRKVKLIFFFLLLVMASINDMIQQYTDMRQGLKQLDLELGTKWQPEDVELEEGDRFSEIMSEYRQKASDKFEDLQTLYLNMDATYKDVMLYYGENPKVMRPDDFFGVFSKFSSSWKDATLAEEKYAQKLERDERRRKEEESRKERLRVKREKEAEKNAAASAAENEEQNGVENVDLSEGNKYFFYWIVYIMLYKKR